MSIIGPVPASFYVCGANFTKRILYRLMDLMQVAVIVSDAGIIEFVNSIIEERHNGREVERKPRGKVYLLREYEHSEERDEKDQPYRV